MSDNFGRLAVCLLQHLCYCSQTTKPNTKPVGLIKFQLITKPMEVVFPLGQLVTDPQRLFMLFRVEGSVANTVYQLPLAGGNTQIKVVLS